MRPCPGDSQLTAGGRIAAVATAALAALAIAAVSRAPWTASPPDHALLRLSWRAPSEVAEQCRPLSAEEKADLPVHMQVPEVCETRAIPYLLEVRIDGAARIADTIHGAGARADRPVTVFRDIPLAVGSSMVDIAFRPLVAGELRNGDDENHENDAREGEYEERDQRPDDEDDEDDEDYDEDDEDEAVSLAYSETLSLQAREVALVAFDRERRALVRVESP